MFKVTVRVKSAPGKNGVGCADFGGVLKTHSDVVLIIIGQTRSVNVVTDITAMVIPLIDQHIVDGILNLLGNIVLYGYGKFLLQCRNNGRFVFFPQLEQKRRQRISSGPGVGDVKNIFSTLNLRYA